MLDYELSWQTLYLALLQIMSGYNKIKGIGKIFRDSDLNYEYYPAALK